MIEMKLVQYIFLVLNKCTKYFLQKKSVQNIVKKRHKIGVIHFFSIK